jgi:hypothetical protein
MLELSGLTGKTLPFKYQQHPITFPHFYHNLQPLGTNTEREIETQGMARALMDFDSQMGVGPEEADKLLSWVRGDGASHVTTLRLQKHLCSIPDNHQSFRNRVSTPEIWHAKATMINSISANHYGPATSKDPSSLSRSSNAAGFKWPSNLNRSQAVCQVSRIKHEMGNTMTVGGICGCQTCVQFGKWIHQS